MDFSVLDRYLASLLDYGFPMYDCTVFRSGRQIYRRVGGYTDVAHARTHTPHTRYFLYSCSKMITTAAALSLYEAGGFSLDEPIARYLPEYAEMAVETVLPGGSVTTRAAARAITVRDLFTMTAGFRYNLNCPSVKGAVAATGGRAPTREVVRALAAEPLSFEPGERWQYSLCHDVLAALVEVIVGERFSEYVRRTVFSPLGMEHTDFRPPVGGAGMATQYRFNDATHAVYEIPLVNSYILGDEYDSGGAGVISSAEDFILFADAMANGGTACTGEQILSPETVRLWQTNALSPCALSSFDWPQYRGYGYGLGIRTMCSPAETNSRSPIGECGWNGAAGATVFLLPAQGISVFCAQHTLNPHEEEIFPAMREAVMRSLAL